MWGYRRTDGLGMLEFLQLAEDIGATALFCNNMGIACTIHTPGGVPCPPQQVQTYVDDTVDAIAYALDPPHTKWGGLRAAHGHPDPFPLDYVNIGNELNSREYTERYPAFYQAIKAKYPAITTIAYAPVGKPKAPVEIKDLHDYRDDAWFRANMNRFDNYERKGPKLSNMELAARNRTNHTLHNALLEAAYMLGLERNADVVRLVSYAPLFMNTHDPRWEPDLIHFDNHRAFGTPSYYAQMLFMHHRPDVVLTTRIDAGGDPDLFALAGRDRQRSEIILKIVNLGSAEKLLEITLSNAGALRPGVAEWQLSAADPLSQNSFDDPMKVAPAPTVTRIAAATFKRSVPANSFTVLRLGVR
jgi:alpha-N-arabinofuranosidase